VYLCYFDESGDHGFVNSPTKFFVLACTMVHESNWLSTLDQLIALRRTLRKTYGLSSTAELKAQHLARGGGSLRGLKLTKRQRHAMYRLLMAQQASLPVLNFAVAIDKAAAAPKNWDPRESAWTFALERVHNFCTKVAGDEHVTIFPDDGHGVFIRKRLRAIRRHHVVGGHFGGSLKIPVDRIIEDPNDRASHHSYFIQLADWNAYAAHRSKYVAPLPRFPGDLWDALGATLLLPVNSLRGGPPGIVLRP